MKVKAWGFGLLVMAFCFGCANQGDVYNLDHRLSALERRSAQLEKKGRDQTEKDQGDSVSLRGQYAGLVAQVDALSQETKLLSGRLEEMEYLLREKLKGYEENLLKNRDRLDRLALDTAGLVQRVDAIDKYLNLEGGQPAPKKKKAAADSTPAPAKHDSDQEIYNRAYQAYSEGRMDLARKRFQELIDRYPKSQHADNAQFWIGETYYREKWYEKAILEYQKVIEKYPSGNKVPAALLKQGVAFTKIGETNNARLVYKQLVDTYPGTNEAGIAKQKLDAL